MQNYNQTYVDVLNSLIEVNTHRYRGYEEVITKTEGSTMKTLFTRLKETSLMCAQELIAEVERLGGVPYNGQIKEAKIDKALLKVKVAITKKDQIALFCSCEVEEYIIEKAYEDALNKAEAVSSEQKQVINKQYVMIRADRDKVKNLRKAFIKLV